MGIAAVTVTADRAARCVDAVILWTGGATSTHTVSLPPVGLHVTTDAGVIARIRELSRDRPDHAVAQALNEKGLRTQTGKEWTYERVQSMRKRHRASDSVRQGGGNSSIAKVVIGQAALGGKEIVCVASLKGISSAMTSTCM